MWGWLDQSDQFWNARRQYGFAWHADTLAATVSSSKFSLPYMHSLPLTLPPPPPSRYVNVSNTVLWFTYTKALFNTGVAKVANKAMTFKVRRYHEWPPALIFLLHFCHSHVLPNVVYLSSGLPASYS